MVLFFNEITWFKRFIVCTYNVNDNVGLIFENGLKIKTIVTEN